MNNIFVFIEHFQGKVADIAYVGLAQAQDIAKHLGSKVFAVLFGSKVDSLSKDLLADEVLIVDHASLADFVYDEYVSTLASMILDKKPGLVIFGDTSIGSDLSSGLSARLKFPLVSFCKEVKIENGKPRYVAQICGGKIFAEGEFPEGTALVSLLPGSYKTSEGQTTTPPKITSYPFPGEIKTRVKLKEMILPTEEDLDISKEKVLVAIGRGIENQDNVTLAQELADALGGVLCASRPVIDQGWLVPSRLVGKSGKSVKPKLYLALGISGAPEHVETIGESEMIIAVNIDPNSPIFNIAKYGTTVNLLDLSEELIQSIQRAKGV